MSFLSPGSIEDNDVLLAPVGLKDVFFCLNGSKRGDEVMTHITAAKLLLVGLILGGCAPHYSQDPEIKEAWQEREAAYIRLAKAITSYCSVSTETIDARQACIIERRLAQSPTDPRILPTAPSTSRLRSSR